MLYTLNIHIFIKIKKVEKNVKSEIKTISNKQKPRLNLGQNCTYRNVTFFRLREKDTK